VRAYVRPDRPVEHGEGVHRRDDEVPRDDGEPHHVGVRQPGDEREERQTPQVRGEEVGAVELLGLARAGVADDDAGAVDGRRQAVGHGLADQDLGLVLGALVVVAERLPFDQGLLGERALVPSADVAGAGVVQPEERGAGPAELEDPFRSVDIDPAGGLAADGQVVDGREMPDL